jgi:hypothetical protein
MCGVWISNDGYKRSNRGRNDHLLSKTWLRRQLPRCTMAIFLMGSRLSSLKSLLMNGSRRRARLPLSEMQSGMSGSADPVKAITDTWTEGLGRTRMHRRLRPPHGHRRLLRTRLERPRRRAAAEKRDELAAFNHSSTSSARPSKVGGISRPRALAVFRLITNWKWVGCSTGRSAG